MMKNNNKQTKGRQKIEMKMIEEEEDRLVSFSKRRSGIYKKASELSTLCGAEIGIIVFSPTRKAFTYGTPSLESVLSRYLHQNPPPNDTAAHLMETSRRARIHELNKQHNELVNELEAEKKRGGMLERTAASELRENKAWWEVPVDRLSMHDVKRLNDVIEELGKSMDRSMKSRSSSPSSELYPRSESNARPNPVAQLQPTHMFANSDVDHGEYSKHEDVYECGFY